MNRPLVRIMKAIDAFVDAVKYPSERYNCITKEELRERCMFWDINQVFWNFSEDDT